MKALKLWVFVQNVLGSVVKSKDSVKRVVLTSSVAGATSLHLTIEQLPFVNQRFISELYQTISQRCTYILPAQAASASDFAIK